jgi:hypothetical protein
MSETAKEWSRPAATHINLGGRLVFYGRSMLFYTASTIFAVKTFLDVPTPH